MVYVGLEIDVSLGSKNIRSSREKASNAAAALDSVVSDVTADELGRPANAIRERGRRHRYAALAVSVTGDGAV